MNIVHRSRLLGVILCLFPLGLANCSHGPIDPLEPTQGAAPLGLQSGKTDQTAATDVVAYDINSVSRLPPEKCPISSTTGTASGPVTTAACRNYIVGVWLKESESKCSVYISLLTRDTSGWNLGLGWGGTILSGLSTAFAKTDVVKPLAAAGSIFTSARNEYDADVLAQKTVGAIADAIQTKRYADRVQIQSNLTAFPKDSSGTDKKYTTDEAGQDAMDADQLAAYPLSIAAADVERFHSDCSLSVGVAQLTANTNQSGDQTDKAVGQTQGQTGNATPNSPAGKSATGSENLLANKLSSGRILVPR